MIEPFQTSMVRCFLNQLFKTDIYNVKIICCFVLLMYNISFSVYNKPRQDSFEHMKEEVVIVEGRPGERLEVTQPILF